MTSDTVAGVPSEESTSRSEGTTDTPASSVRATLLWIAEVLTTPKIVMRCQCGHDLAEHTWADDETGNGRPWPCTFPQRYGAPVVLCECEDFTE